MADLEKRQIIVDVDVIADKSVKTVTDLVGQLQHLQTEQKKVGETTGKNSVEYQKYETAIRATKKSIQEERKVTLDSLKAKLSSKDSIEQLRSSLSRLKTAYIQLSESERKSASGQKLLAKIQSTTKAVTEAEQSMGVYSRNVGNYEDAIKSAIGGNNQFASSLLDIDSSGGGISGMLSNAGVSVKAFGKTCWGLMKNPAFLVIAGLAAAGAALKFWYDYNKGLVVATKLTKDFTNLSGEALKTHRVGVQTLADFYEKDFKEVLMSSNALAKQFGIEQSEALAMIKEGFISGADANGEYLHTLKEYPTFFKEAGLEASEFIAIVAQTAKAGIHSDKGIDTIKEATISLREMSKIQREALAGIGISADEMQRGLEDGTLSIFKAIQQVSKRIGELPPNSAAVGTAIADIFKGAGEDAGLEFVTGIATINTNLEEMVKETAGILGGLQRELMDSQENVSKATSLLFDASGGSFESFVTNIKTDLNNLWANVLTGFNNFSAKRAHVRREMMNERNRDKALASADNDNASKELEILAKRIEWTFFGITKFSAKTIKSATKNYNKAMSLQVEEHKKASIKIRKDYADRQKFEDAYLKHRITGKPMPSIEELLKSDDMKSISIPLKPEFMPEDAKESGGQYGKLWGEGFNEHLKKLQTAPTTKKTDSTDDSGDTTRRQTKITTEAQQAQYALELELHANNFAKRRSIELRAFKESIALQKQEIAESLNANDITQAQADDKYNALIKQMELFRLKQAREGETFAQEQRDQILSMIDPTAGNQINAIKAKYEEAFAILDNMKEPIRVDFITDADFDDAVERYKDFMFDTTYLDYKQRLEAQKAKEISDIQKAELQRRHEAVETATDEMYEDDLIKFQNNEQKKAEILIESLKTQIALKKAQGLDTTDEEMQLVKAHDNLSDIQINAFNDRMGLLNNELAIEMLTAKQRYDIRAKAIADEMAMEGLSAEQMANLNEAKLDNEAQYWNDRAQMIEKWGGIAMSAMSAVGDLMTALNERELEELESKHEQESEMLQNQLDKGIISQEQFDNKQKALDADLARSQAKIAREQAIRDKAMAMFDIMLNTALGIMATIGQAGFFGIPLAAIVGAMGAVQLAAVASQPLPKASKGMYIQGASHANGGVPIEAEGGEVIMSKGAVSMFGSQLSAMNVAGGGIPFPVQHFPVLPIHNIPDGGYGLKQVRESASTDVILAELAELRALSNAILSRPMYLTVEDYRRADKQYSEIIDRGRM